MNQYGRHEVSPIGDLFGLWTSQARLGATPVAPAQASPTAQSVGGGDQSSANGERTSKSTWAEQTAWWGARALSTPDATDVGLGVDPSLYGQRIGHRITNCQSQEPHPTAIPAEGRFRDVTEAYAPDPKAS
jgi:hypothetical protein